MWFFLVVTCVVILTAYWYIEKRSAEVHEELLEIVHEMGDFKLKQ